MGNLRSCAVLLAALFIAILSTGTGAQSDAAAWLAAHNAARRAVGAGLPPLTWNSAAYQAALAWARNRAAISGCPIQHSGSKVYGENLAWSSSTATTPTSTVGSWVAEKAYYNYASNTCASVCGHYTQVVWKATTSVGCAWVYVPAWTCKGHKGGKFYVCSYYPKGNVSGRRPY